jgi:hypothetical protein
VNPLQFILQNFMGNNLFIVKIRPMEFAHRAPGTEYMEYVRKIIPPHTSYIVYVELTPNTDEIDLGEDTEESQEIMRCVIESDSYDTSSDVGETIGLRLVPDGCGTNG